MVGALGTRLAAALRCVRRRREPGALVATLQSSGTVTVRDLPSDRVVATLRPGLYEAGWQLHRAASDDGLIQIAGGTVRVQSEVWTDGTALCFRYVLTPGRAVHAHSVHLSIQLPAPDWVGARYATSDGASGTVPEVVQAVQLVASRPSCLTLAQTAQQVTVDASGAPLLLQDHRAFGGADLEIRLGRQSPTAYEWPAGQPVTLSGRLDLGTFVSLEREAPVRLAAGREWAPLRWGLEIAPGSALDRSAANHAPAGKYGRVVARPDGHFGFADGTGPERFCGTNLCYSAQYLPRREADRLAARLARLGYNSLRLHHYEADLIDPRAPDSLTFRADRLDQLDYLLAACKRAGIYVTLDLFVSRPLRPSEGPSGDEFKLALLVCDRALENWKAFAAKLLRHHNPHTGLAWKDDPALAWISLVNAPNAVGYLDRLRGDLSCQFQAAWEAWLRERYVTDARVAEAWRMPTATLTMPFPTAAGETPLGRDVAAFLAVLHERTYARMERFVREEIGTEALLTYLNGWSDTPSLMTVRSRLDWVSNHFYWDHPHPLTEGQRLPVRGWSGGGSALAADGGGLARMAATRHWGKPFGLSEYHYAAPNRCRAEGGLLVGAAAALQDWDAVWHFAYAHSRRGVQRPQPTDHFNLASDPAAMAGQLASAFLFRRGDVAPAPELEIATVSREALLRGERPALPAGAIWNRLVGLELGETSSAVAVSRPPGSPEQVAVDPQRETLRIATPRFAAVIAPPGTRISVGPVQVAVEEARAVVWAASLDGAPLEESRRLLLAHVTEVQNTGMRFSGPERRVLLAWGRLPHLVRVGRAVVSLTHAEAVAPRAWRLDAAGRRHDPLAVSREAGAWRVDLATRAPDGHATLFYELAW